MADKASSSASFQASMRDLSVKSALIAMAFLIMACAGKSNDLVGRLEKSRNHYDWVTLSVDIQKRDIPISNERATAFVKYNLALLTFRKPNDRGSVMSEILSLGEKATPALVEAISEAASPAPIFTNSAVANIPGFSMQILAQMKSKQAICALIDYIDRFETDVHIVGETHNAVVRTLIAITGKDFGTDKTKWKKWYFNTEFSENQQNERTKQ